MSPDGRIYEFEDFRLDLTEKTLLRGTDPVSITPKVFETLRIFAENPNRLIEKDELMEKLWPERFVEESNLTFNIKMLRKALGDDASSPTFIETIPTRGYRFIPAVRKFEPATFNAGANGDSQPLVGLPTASPASVQTGSHSSSQRVVALADWRHDEARPDERTQQVELKLAPERPVSPKGLKYLAVVAAVAIVAGAGLGYYFFFYAEPRGESIDSVAVLPFINETGDANTDYLSEGLSDSIINGLSRLPNLKVNSLNSVLRYKGKSADPKDVGRELNVRAVLVGKLTQRGEDVLISAELVDVTDDRRLWGGQYSRKLSDMLTIRNEIAREISEGLRLRLSGEQTELLAKQYTNNNDAWLSYSMGQYFARQNTKEGFEKAVESFERATQIDPNYALAYTAIGNTYQFMMSRGFLPPKEYAPKVELSALKALQIDDSLAEAHAGLGAYRLITFDWKGAELEIKRALELDPKSTYANSAYAHYLIGIGRTDEALNFELRARELEPSAVRGETAFAYYMARDYDKAIELYLKNLDKNPENAHASILLGEAYIANGNPSDGLSYVQKGLALDKTLEKTPGRWDRYPLLAFAYAANGRRDEAEKILDDQLRLAETQYVSPYNFAIIYTALGDKDRAFARLEECIEQRIMIIYHLKTRPIFDSLRSDSRYVDLLAKMNLTP